MVESSKKVAPWRSVVALTVGEQVRTVLDGPVAVRLDFVMPRPKSTPKRSTPPAVKRPDLDKLVRAVLDACTEVAWRDDSQVISLSASKRIAELDGDIPGVHITFADPYSFDGYLMARDEAQPRIEPAV